PDAVGIGGVRLAIAHTRLAHGDRTDTGHHLALRQVTVADDALVTIPGLQIGMLAEKVCNLGLYCLGEQATRPIAQDFGELILDVSWLNQLDDVIFGHGISLLWWRSGGVKHPHDMPPFRFPPSPTLGDSSPRGLLKHCFPPVRTALSDLGECCVTVLMDSNKYSTQVERLGVVETGRPRRWTDDEKLKIAAAMTFSLEIMIPLHRSDSAFQVSIVFA